MEVGIEDCLHIEFEYERGAYHMSDTVLGRIHFLLVSGRVVVSCKVVQLCGRQRAGTRAQ
jgi:vacuolar protein sorting-associated protein 26